jgi:hypothetical protein
MVETIDPEAEEIEIIDPENSLPEVESNSTNAVTMKKKMKKKVN